MMRKVTISSCASCKGKADAFKKIKGVDKVESDSTSFVVIGKFDLDEVRRAVSCHHSALRSIENNYEPPKKKEEPKKEEKKDEKKKEDKKGDENAVHIYLHYK